MIRETTTDIKFTGSRAYEYSRFQGRWFPIAYKKAMRRLAEGKSRLGEGITLAKG